jgi:hypothetical protein
MILWKRRCTHVFLETWAHNLRRYESLERGGRTVLDWPNLLKALLNVVVSDKLPVAPERELTGYLSFYDPEVRTQSQLSATMSERTDTVACSILCTKYLCVVLYSQGISLHFTSYVQFRFLSHRGLVGFC